jgi:hypothetical protein
MSFRPGKAGSEDFSMIGRFNETVVHLPSGRQGKVVMHPAGSIGIFSTPVEFQNGNVEELPDSELRLAQNDGSFTLNGMRFASNRPIPGSMTVNILNNGNGTVTIVGQIPGNNPVTVPNLPIKNGEIVLPDELFFPISR